MFVKQVLNIFLQSSEFALIFKLGFLDFNKKIFPTFKIQIKAEKILCNWHVTDVIIAILHGYLWKTCNESKGLVIILRVLCRVVLYIIQYGGQIKSENLTKGHAFVRDLVWRFTDFDETFRVWLSTHKKHFGQIWAFYNKGKWGKTVS